LFFRIIVVLGGYNDYNLFCVLVKMTQNTNSLSTDYGLAHIFCLYYNALIREKKTILADDESCAKRLYILRLCNI